MIDGVINCPKSPTTEPRCHSDQVDPLVYCLLVLVSCSAFYRRLNFENPLIFVVEIGKNQLLKAKKINRRGTII